MIKNFVKITFKENSESGRTKVWLVKSRITERQIGEIKWHRDWTRYCFFGHFDLPLTGEVMNEISQFVIEETERHKTNYRLEISKLKVVLTKYRKDGKPKLKPGRKAYQPDLESGIMSEMKEIEYEFDRSMEIT